MKKNWYAVYTKPHSEKKVTAILKKKKIECYCPMIGMMKQKRIVYQPLFTSYIFVSIPQGKLKVINHTNGVVNFLYWLDKPVVIKNDEIEAIKRFVHDHENIKLEKIDTIYDRKPFTDKSLITIEERMIPVKNETVKILHTSLGFSIIAEVDEVAAEIIYKENNGKNGFLRQHREVNDSANS
jgi:transcription antitermination factor NusG